ncbi:hypothetical protein, partial [Vibrio parahaemolyticus]|uniref:hypothetical protein n=1 Tax=Vibrio parahaemolyticus TaxID=670 RepID=UPI001D156067
SALERQAAEELQRQISVLETQREALQARVAEIEDTARQSVTAEAELAALDRERDPLREQPVGVANRRVAAESQQRRDIAMVSDSFTLLEKAVPPDYPMSSQRKKIALGGGMLSVLAALALTLLMEMRRPVIRTAAQMERITGLRPVIDLPDTKQKNPRRGGSRVRDRRRTKDGRRERGATDRRLAARPAQDHPHGLEPGSYSHMTLPANKG